MPDAVCLDTNILIYAALGKIDEPGRWAVAHDLIAYDGATLPAQVLAEFYAVATGKKHRLDPRIANQWVERLTLMPTVWLDADMVVEGIALSQRYGIDYWDGAVLAASHRCGAEVLYSEDMNHGQLYGSVRVINPFIERP